MKKNKKVVKMHEDNITSFDKIRRMSVIGQERMLVNGQRAVLGNQLSKDIGAKEGSFLHFIKANDGVYVSASKELSHVGYTLRREVNVKHEARLMTGIPKAYSEALKGVYQYDEAKPLIELKDVLYYPIMKVQ